MISTPLISVIVPVFNTGKYLKKCLDSLIYQTYPNLEIICIDDGSTDNSVEIINKYNKKTKSKVILYTQNHSGASAARNLGIEKAAGEYLSFIDSDDWVFLTLYQVFVEYLNKSCSDLDIYMFNASAYVEGQNDVIPKTFFNISDWGKPKDKYARYTFNDCIKPFTRNLSAANKIYRKDFLFENNIQFPENLKYEDQYFGIKSFLNAKSIMINDDIFYRYRNMTDTSSTLEITPKAFDIFKIVDLVEEEVYHHHLYETYKYALFQYKFNSFSSHYLYCPVELRKKFYEEMKKRLREAATRNLDMRIASRLRNFKMFELIKNCTFDEFDKFITPSR